MGWKETCAVDERMRFVLAVEAEEETMAALCRRFGVSRQNGYKWLARYREEGAAGLFERSRAPLTHPHAVSAAVAERCLGVRREHPTWGPVKVRAYLERRAAGLELPAASTLGTTILYNAMHGHRPTVDLIRGIPRGGFLMAITPYRLFFPGLG